MRKRLLISLPEESTFMLWRTSLWVLAFLIGLSISTRTEGQTRLSKQPFGKTSDGTPVELYTLSDGAMKVRVMTYGGIVQSIEVPDRKGKLGDVVLGYDSVDKYIANSPFFGAIIGRYGNRIAHGKFQLDGNIFTLPKNDGENSLHGGTRGFDKVVWSAHMIENGVELKYLSKDGDQGYPGNLEATVRYTLVNKSLQIEYSATTDKDTVLNLTNHSYFNLAGEGSGDVLQQRLKIDASRFTPVDSALIPTGDLKQVAGTPFDFKTPHSIGERVNESDEQLRNGKGYDHNWVLDRKPGGELVEAASVEDPSTGRILRVLTTEPGLQFYSGNFLDGSIVGKAGHVYGHRSGFCLETQHFPDSPNHKNFPSTELKPGERYHSVTVFQFDTRAGKD
jgi:aldose 1-epimerase